MLRACIGSPEEFVEKTKNCRKWKTDINTVTANWGNKLDENGSPEIDEDYQRGWPSMDRKEELAKNARKVKKFLYLVILQIIR